VSERRLTFGRVAEAVRGRIVSGDPGLEIGDVVTDTRTLQQGDVLVALRGPRFDAHDFLADAFARGAVAAIVERGRGTAHPNAGIVEVDDTLKALQDLAHAVRVEAGTKVVAITGSAGKTTTKEAIAELLSTRFRVVKNKGNLNNHIGLPLSLMQLRTGPDVAVMELGMNHAGEISTLVAIAERGRRTPRLLPLA
jgi:UDP-N-acetylmuramoyl-tripeptide--D-alanyl-D-alanine ligase